MILTSRKNSLELIELSSMNKVGQANVVSLFSKGYVVHTTG